MSMEGLARYGVIKFNKIYNFMDVPTYSSTLSSAAKYLEKQAQTDIQLAQLMNKIRKNCIKSNYPKPDPKI